MTLRTRSARPRGVNDFVTRKRHTRFWLGKTRITHARVLTLSNGILLGPGGDYRQFVRFRPERRGRGTLEAAQHTADGRGRQRGGRWRRADVS